jgi:hypothetical protein
MENNLSLHFKMFNDKLKVMSQTSAKTLVLTATEARSLQSDIFDLLNHCATLSQKLASGADDNAVTQINMDGGGF